MSRVKKTLNLKTQSMSKRKKLPCVDRISNLPDSLLCHILSFLPTEQVVATSILSSRWTTLWTHVPYLHFYDSSDYRSSEYRRNDKRMRFTHFVCRVLTLLKAPTVKTFRLHFKPDTDPFHVNTWICAALGRGVKELDLSSFCRTRNQLPRIAFTCESLVVLKLENYTISLNRPSYVHLPSLKILHLGFTVCKDEDDEDSVDKLISGCPILEDLHVARSLQHVTTFNISIPTLKRLQVELDISTPICWGAKVQINTPSLDYLVIEDPHPADFLLENLPKLVEADVDISLNFNRKDDENYGDCVLKLLRGLYNVKILSFYYLTRAINISSDDLPLFHNLVKLSLCVDSFNCQVFKTLIENSPNLKVLDIENETARSRGTNKGRELFWSQPSRVPECLSSHLETFNMSGFKGWENELEFVKYILKNAQVLVTATVCAFYLLDFEEKFDLLSKLSMFPRGSKTCQLAFHEGKYLKS